MYGAMLCARSVLLARDRIKGTILGSASSVLLARDHNTERRAGLFRCSSQVRVVRTIQCLVLRVFAGMMLFPPSQPVRTAQRAVEAVG